MSLSEHKAFTSSDKMSELIDCDNSILLVMNRFDIPLGFGEKTVREVCAAREIDENTFLTVSNFICGNEWSADNVSIPALISYLKKAHSYFLDFMLPAIRRRLIESIDCSGTDEVAFLILTFYDAYVTEVRNHMEYENRKVFTYVERLLEGNLDSEYCINDFSQKHNHIDIKLKELKNIIVRYYPQQDNNLLYSVLFDIINCERDLDSHCSVEDCIFVPAVEDLESRIRNGLEDVNISSTSVSDRRDGLSQREKEILVCVAKGMSTKEIADFLYISVHTVTTHRRNISSKLQIHTPAGLTIYALVNNLLTMSEIKNI
ncbi:MAG: response regulator transcription factor [Candidatus Cryptobacteroides sp.]